MMSDKRGYMRDEHEMMGQSAATSTPSGYQRGFTNSVEDEIYGNNSSMRALNSQAQASTDLKAHPRASAKRRDSVSMGRNRIILFALVIVAVLVVAITVPIVLTVGRRHGSGHSGSDAHDGQPALTSGGNGSNVTMEDGSTFVYVNSFGGEWAADPADPFASGGKSQSWSPRVGGMERWDWSRDVARGVNLGGWLVTEPFICPGLYERYVNQSTAPLLDEWTLSVAMGDNLATEMEEHYRTFITERDFADIAAAGLNWARIPIGFWAIETVNDEPFLAGTSWSYFLKAIQWARKYGLRIYLDLHSLPGSQNGWNHSGRSGSVNFMHGVMGVANAQRTLTYLRIITQFVSQEQYRDVVPIVGIVNEILWDTIGEGPVQSFYWAAYQAIRGATGIGADNGPYIAIHEGFQGPAIWEGFLSGADRLALDQHPYLAFMGDTTTPIEELARRPCDWAVATNQSQRVFGITIGGEFSSAINDCGYWLSGIGSTPSYPDCSSWDDWNSWNETMINNIRQVTLASMDALQNYFFWTWRIGESSVLGTSSSPMWHYKLGLERGWIPRDPREAIGHCAGILNETQPFDGQYPSTATGGFGAGSVAEGQTSIHSFPPATISPSFTGTEIALLPTYTPTGTIRTLFAPTFTSAPSAVVGDGWANDADNGLAYVPVAGCPYPDAWDAVSAALPSNPCTGA